MIFDPDAFRLMLSDRALMGSFAARYPEAKELFTQFLDGTRLEFPAFPQAVKALEWSLFDNGPPVAKPSKAIRPRKGKTLRMNAQFVLALTAWDRERENVDLRNPRHVAWSAKAFMWSAQHAATISTDLLSEKLITPDTKALMDWTIEGTGGNSLYSIVSQKAAGGGTKWTTDVAFLEMESGWPVQAGLFFSQSTGHVVADFDGLTSKGTALASNVIAQARIPFAVSWSDWGTVPTRTA